MVRIPRDEWKPAGYVAPTTEQKLVTRADVGVDHAWRTPQFALLWIVLCFNVTAGIGILEQASPMIQEMLLVPRATTGLTAGTADWTHAVAPLAAIAGGYVGFLSLFNMLGRFGWSSLSDVIGRKPVYFIYLLLGAALYLLIPVAGRSGSVPLFVAVTAVILSMYGGGFATVPAYLRDLFGTAQIGAIHGRLLTAWSVAGILGPLLVNRIREHQIALGAVGVERYAPTMYLMAALLVIAAVCNALIRPVDSKYHMKASPTL